MYDFCCICMTFKNDVMFNIRVCVCTENAEMMKEDFKQQPCMVDRLYGMPYFYFPSYHFIF